MATSLKPSVALHDSKAIQAAATFIDHLFPAPRHFDIRLWDGTLLKGDGPTLFTLVIHLPGALKRMFSLPIELKLGEAYVRGDFDVEGKPFAIIDALHEMARAGIFSAVNHIPSFSREAYRVSRWLALAKHWLNLPDDSAANALQRSDFNPPEQIYSRQRSRDAVAYHYDVSNEFYALWLGQRMVYSCAYFTDPSEDIDAAQTNKLEYICRKLQLRPGERLLDIGCGWGGMVIYAAQHYGVSALGITLSQQQYDLAAQRVQEAGIADRVMLKIMDYRDLRGETFDKISAIGMFEHVGRSNLYTYFRTVYDILRPGGLFMNQGTGAAYEPPRSLMTALFETYIIGRGQFSLRYVLPDGYVHPISSANVEAERAGFEVRDVENIRDHWSLTLREWIRRLETNEHTAVQLVGEHAYRIWRIYLYASLTGFEAGSINESQTLFAKPDAGRSGLPLTRQTQLPLKEA